MSVLNSFSKLDKSRANRVQKDLIQLEKEKCLMQLFLRTMDRLKTLPSSIFSKKYLKRAWNCRKTIIARHCLYRERNSQRIWSSILKVKKSVTEMFLLYSAHVL